MTGFVENKQSKMEEAKKKSVCQSVWNMIWRKKLNYKTCCDDDGQFVRNKGQCVDNIKAEAIF